MRWRRDIIDAAVTFAMMAHDRGAQRELLTVLPPELLFLLCLGLVFPHDLPAKVDAFMVDGLSGHA